MGSSCVRKDTATNRFPSSFPLEAHLGIKTASSQADGKLVAAEDSDPPKETNLTSSHSAMEDSWAIDSERAANPKV